MYNSEQVKDKLWKRGIQIMYGDLRVILKYLKCKKGGHFSISSQKYAQLVEFLS